MVRPFYRLAEGRHFLAECRHLGNELQLLRIEAAQYIGRDSNRTGFEDWRKLGMGQFAPLVVREEVGRFDVRPLYGICMERLNCFLGEGNGLCDACLPASERH